MTNVYAHVVKRLSPRKSSSLARTLTSASSAACCARSSNSGPLIDRSCERRRDNSNTAALRSTSWSLPTVWLYRGCPTRSCSIHFRESVSSPAGVGATGRWCRVETISSAPPGAIRMFPLAGIRPRRGEIAFDGRVSHPSPRARRGAHAGRRCRAWRRRATGACRRSRSAPSGRGRRGASRRRPQRGRSRSGRS